MNALAKEEEASEDCRFPNCGGHGGGGGGDGGRRRRRGGLQRK